MSKQSSFKLNVFASATLIAFASLGISAHADEVKKAVDSATVESVKVEVPVPVNGEAKKTEFRTVVVSGSKNIWHRKSEGPLTPTKVESGK